LDLMILEVFSNINDSMVLFYESTIITCGENSLH